MTQLYRARIVLEHSSAFIPIYISRLGTATYRDMYRKSITDPEKFWAKEARSRVNWRRDFDTTKRVDLSGE